MSKISKEKQEQYGYTDEQAKSLSEGQAKLVEEIDGVLNYRIIAEVVKSENCVAGHNVGDKFVLNGAGQLLPHECTNKDCLCLFAVGKLTHAAAIVYDRIMSGLDPTSGSVFGVMRCEDVGVENGGWGEIVMNISVKK